MRTRTAEVTMAVIMGLLSLYLMWKSAELPIGWTEGRGPGGGAWPFWLAGVMLICCLVTIVRWFGRKTPESRSEAEYMDTDARRINFVTVGSLLAFLVLTHFIGMYFAMMLFLFFYVRFVGRHSWLLTFVLALGVPIFLFFFFEALLKIILPKGYSEPLFYPLYRIIF
ncbi:MAG: tripartite tricarboxylate transporter TctB family protein [Gammaproteobacteria bacterium]|nr:tripartite tricarboxylate transporter TctB family protein [Gammaproteobacteria bacterium]